MLTTASPAERTARLILAVIPVGLFVLSVIVANHHGPYFLRNNFDPDYNYLLNSLSLLKFHTPGHTDHPGTTLQILGAAVLLFKWLGALLLGHRQTLTDSVLSHPEEYLRVINVVLNILIGGTLYGSAWCVYRLSKSLTAGMLLQGTVLVYSQTFLSMPRVSPEPLLMAVGLALMVPLAPMVLLREGTEENGKRLAGAAGAIFGFGLITKITFAPWAATILLFPQRSQKRRFVATAAAAALVPLLPAAGRFSAMASWFTSLLVHSGHYGTGRIGIPEANVLTANLLSLWQVEPPLFLFLALYTVLLVVFLLFHPEGMSLTNRARPLLLAASIAIVAGIAMVVKHPANHYLIPVLVLTAFVNSTLWVRMPRFDLNGALVRRLCQATMVQFIGMGLVHNWSSFWWWVEAARTDRRSVAELHALEESLPGCQIIGSFRSSLKVYALSFAGDYSAGVHADALEKLYPGSIHYDPFNDRFTSFNDVKSDDVQRLVSSGHCVLMETTPLAAGILQRFALDERINFATLMTVPNPIIPFEATTVYRLEPRGLP